MQNNIFFIQVMKKNDILFDVHKKNDMINIFFERGASTQE